MTLSATIVYGDSTMTILNMRLLAAQGTNPVPLCIQGLFTEGLVNLHSAFRLVVVNIIIVLVLSLILWI